MTSSPIPPSNPVPLGDPPELNTKLALWRIVTHFDKTKLSLPQGVRNTIGVLLPLIGGFLLNMPRGGLAMASGALNVSFSDGHDPYPVRARRMLASTVWCAIAIFLGALAGRHNVEAVVVITVWAFVAGLLVAIGTTAADLGVISLVMLVVYAAQPLTPLQAAQSGLLALAGGLLQTGFSVLLWPVRRFDPERRALSALFLDLASAATKPLQTATAPPASLTSSQASEVVASLNDNSSIEAIRFRAILDQAERIRLSLMMLSRLRLRMEREKPDHPANEVLVKFLENSADVLRAIGNSLTSNKAVGLEADRVVLGVALAYQLRVEHGEHSRVQFFDAVLQDAQFQMDSLSGQLRAAIDLTSHATVAGAAAFAKREALQPLWLRYSGKIATLRANLNFNSTAFRHALRLAATVAIGAAFGRFFDWRRSYWIPMTIVLVLKPEFTVTFSRGILRICGTVLGLILATAMFHFLPIHTTTEVILVGVFMFMMRWLGPANYGVFAVAVSALVVLLLTINGVSPKEVIVARGVNTIAGGVLALLAYAAWPTWERTRIADTTASLIEAYRDYFSAVAAAYAREDVEDRRALDSVRQRSRTMRTNLEGSIERLAAEPGVTQEHITHANALLASTHRFAYAVMALEAGLPLTPPVPPRSEFHVFVKDVVRTLQLLELLLKGGRVPEKDFPNLREDHNRLIQAGDPGKERYALVNIEADRMTNSLNTLREQVVAWSRTQHRTKPAA